VSAGCERRGALARLDHGVDEAVDYGLIDAVIESRKGTPALAAG